MAQELKTYDFPVDHGDFTTTIEQFYLKSEADKVISHQERKRCLAMARIAQDDWHLHNSFYAMGHQEFEKRKCEFYEKWRERWLGLAKKFKDKEA